MDQHRILTQCYPASSQSHLDNSYKWAKWTKWASIDKQNKIPPPDGIGPKKALGNNSEGVGPFAALENIKSSEPGAKSGHWVGPGSGQYVITANITRMVFNSKVAGKKMMGFLLGKKMHDYLLGQFTSRSESNVQGASVEFEGDNNNATSGIRRDLTSNLLWAQDQGGSKVEFSAGDEEFVDAKEGFGKNGNGVPKSKTHLNSKE